MKILIIEDEKDIGIFLKTSLEKASFAVDWEETGEKGLFSASTTDYDLIILDLNLPDTNGLDVCKKIRMERKNTPILILTVNSEISSKVELLNAGADDYLTKPFSVSEAIARIKALLRRPKEIIRPKIGSEDLILNEENQSVIKNSKEIYLTRKEFMLLEYFIRNKGRVLSRGEIIEHVWDSDADIFSNTIETHVLNLRKKINKNSHHQLIRTCSGRGYAFD
jgi:DNA-binding response OmpR family regulator